MRFPNTNIILGSYTQEARRYFDAMTVTPDSPRRRLIDSRLIRPLRPTILGKTAGLWLLAAHDEQAGRLNVAAPGTLTLTAVNSPSFVADRGFQSDGATSYLDTLKDHNLIPLIGMDDVTLLVWSLTDVTEAVWDIGTGNAFAVSGRSTSTTLRCRMNTTANSDGTISDSLGLYGGSRVDAANTIVVKNGQVLASPAVSSTTAPGTTTPKLLRAGSLFSNKRLSAGVIARALTTAEHLTLYNALLAYMRGIGAVT